MNVTVAICTRNRAAMLGGALEALRRVRVPISMQWEVLVIDNGSVDDTRDMIDLFADHLPVRVVSEPRAGVSHARNRALLEARGEWVLFTDDDARPEREWLACFTDLVRRDPQAAVVGGAIDPFFPEAPDEDLAAAFPMVASGFCGLDHGPVERVLAPPHHLFTANMGVRLDAIGTLRFDEALGPSPRSRRVGEDAAFVDAARARGLRVVWCPGMRVRHHVDPRRLRLPSVIRHHLGYSESMVHLRGRPPERFLLLRALVNGGLFVVNRLMGRKRAAFLRLRAACHWFGSFRAAPG